MESDCQMKASPKQKATQGKQICLDDPEGEREGRQLRTI